MKILGQKVARATVEVDGLVQGRIGTGLVLMLGIREGTSDEEIETAASKVMKLKLWPETLPGEEMPKPPKLANIVDKGYEVLVLLQQSLCASFPSAAPSLKEVMEPAEAQLLFEEFVKRLQQQYQEEMVLAAPQRGHVRIESTSDGEIFDLSALALSSAARRAGKTEKGTKPPALNADVSSMTRALKVLKTMERSKRDLAGAQLYKLMGDPKFQQLLADANEAAAEGFAAALEEASPFFSKEQQEQITDWTGLTMTAPPEEAKTEPMEPKVEEKEELEEMEEEDEEVLEAEVTSEQLARQLEELREEARDPEGFAARKAAASKAAALPRSRRPSIAPKPKPTMAAVQGWQRPAEPKKPPEPKTPPPGYVARARQSGSTSMTSSVARVPLPTAKGTGRSRRSVEDAPLDEWDRPKEELEDGEFRQAGKRRNAFETGPSKFMKGTQASLAPMTPAPEDFKDI